MTRWEWLQQKYPEACKPRTWEEYYEQRIRTGGTPRAATLFANYMRPDDLRPADSA